MFNVYVEGQNPWGLPEASYSLGPSGFISLQKYVNSESRQVLMAGTEGKKQEINPALLDLGSSAQVLGQTV